MVLYLSISVRNDFNVTTMLCIKQPVPNVYELSMNNISTAVRYTIEDPYALLTANTKELTKINISEMAEHVTVSYTLPTIHDVMY